MPEDPQTQTAYSTSVFTDPLMLLNLALLALQLEEVHKLIPLAIMGYVTAAIAVGNLVLRFTQAVRPVSFIAPAQVKPVEIKKLEMTQPGSETPKP